jgi:hypothetical protein
MTAYLSSKGRLAVAKGQKRSNREIRKPKQNKAAPKADAAFGDQMKLSANTPGSRAKAKK